MEYYVCKVVVFITERKKWQQAVQTINNLSIIDQPDLVLQITNW